MYYILYPIFYLLSLLPWRILYFLADILYGLVYYVIRYRKKVVFQHLLQSFPEKTAAQRERIAKEFYHNFIDSFIEIIKLISISGNELEKRFACDPSLPEQVFNDGQNIQIHTAHFFNWEFINLRMAQLNRFPFIVVYMTLANKAMDRIIYNMRRRFGTILMSTTGYRTHFHKYARARYVIALAADQNPVDPNRAIWVPFMNRTTAFLAGPEKGAQRYNAAVIFGNFYKVKRGYYRINFSLITRTPRETKPGEITSIFAALVEKSIRERPANYLWSHRRWKHLFDEEKYKKNTVIK